MEQSTITLTLNGNTYRLCSRDTEAIGKISKTDREQLIYLLETIKQQDRLLKSIPQTDKQNGLSEKTPRDLNLDHGLSHQGIKTDRLSKGDVDNLMARLIIEEKSDEKPGITKQTIYKAIGFIAAVIILLILVF